MFNTKDWKLVKIIILLLEGEGDYGEVKAQQERKDPSLHCNMLALLRLASSAEPNIAE